MRLPFKKADPVAEAAAKVNADADRLARFKQREAKAEQAVADDQAAIDRHLANDGDDARLHALQARHRGSVDVLQHIRQHVSAAHATLSSSEDHHTELVRSNQATQSIATVDRQKRQLGEFFAELERFCISNAGLLASVSAYTPEGGPVAQFVQRLPTEIGQALELVYNGMAGYQTLLDSGAVNPVLPAPEAPPAPVAVERAPATVELMAASHLTWTDQHTGNQRVHPRGHRVILPLALAERALEIKAAVPMGSPQAKVLIKQQHSTLIASSNHCVSLDQPQPAELQAA